MPDRFELVPVFLVPVFSRPAEFVFACIGIPVNRASVVFGILFQASRADDGLRQAWRRRIWKAVAVTLSLFLARE